MSQHHLSINLNKLFSYSIPCMRNIRYISIHPAGMLCSLLSVMKTVTEVILLQTWRWLTGLQAGRGGGGTLRGDWPYTLIRPYGGVTTGLSRPSPDWKKFTSVSIDASFKQHKSFLPDYSSQTKPPVVLAKRRSFRLKTNKSYVSRKVTWKVKNPESWLVNS